MWRAGHVTYGVAVAAMGLVCLLAGNLGSVFQPVPRWMPWPHGMAYASGAMMLAGGLALLVARTAERAALALTMNFSFWLLLLNLPTTITHPTVVGAWEGCGLNMTVVAGGLLLLGQNGTTLARRTYAIGLPLIALAHFGDAHDAIVYVPMWLPLRIGWVYVTGVAHGAAGLAILFGVLPRLAAVLEAIQISSFVVLVHVPSVCGAPRDREPWAMLLYAAAIAGSGWLVAATYREQRPRARTLGDR
jgi:uncharacterized membrane protein